MKTKFFVLMSVVGLFWCCAPEKGKMENAQATIDSLRQELQVQQDLTETMTEVGALIDSIDENRKALRVKMVEGTDFDNYSKRMADINEYVKRTERRIASLETDAKQTRAAGYPTVIKKLKADLEKRSQEIAALEEQVKVYRNQNDNLVQTVSLQKAELDDKLNQLKVKQDEASQLEEQVKQLLVQSKLDEGEAYFERAVAVEETAKRTQFAPKKKKNSLKQALELYRMAQLYGKTDAQSKVEELEKRLSKSHIL